MVETKEQQNNWFWEFFDKINNDLTWLLDKIKNTRNDIMKNLWIKQDKETKNVEKETKKEMDKLAEKLINIELDKLKDKELDIEWDLDKLNDETTILWLLARNNESIKSWFEWLKDVDDEDVRSWEIEMILLSLKEISDDDKNKQWDLTEQELKEIWENTKKKMEICENVLKNNDVKKLPEDKKTKKAILEAYNNALSDNKWDISKITEEKIIDKLKETKE